MPALRCVVADAILLGAHAAERHRVDELQVAGIEAKRQMDLAGRAAVIQSLL